MNLQSQNISYIPKQIIFSEGNLFNGIYLIQEGQVEVFRVRENTEVVLGVLNPGDVLGTITLFSKGARTASARAVMASVLAFYPSDGLSEAFQELPVWSQAVMKDSIGRLRHVNDLLVATKLNERNLLHRAGTSHHHATQLAYLLASFLKKGSRDIENNMVYVVKDFLGEAEAILMKKYSYLENIYKAFLESSLIKESEDKKFGRFIPQSSAQGLEDFAAFSLQIVKKGDNYFTPQKYYPWMNALVRISKKNNNQEKFKYTDLSLLLKADLGAQNTGSVMTDLIKNKIIEEKDGQIFLQTVKLHRTVVFESLSRMIKEIKAED
jgi:CRP/FNR family cyclic AMP-dependent transcriptional regulator